MVCCEVSEFDQKFGSAIFFSMSANCWRRRGASKILPQLGDLLQERSEFAFEFFDHG
jgi:hypothetical protein